MNNENSFVNSSSPSWTLIDEADTLINKTEVELDVSDTEDERNQTDGGESVAASSKNVHKFCKYVTVAVPVMLKAVPGIVLAIVGIALIQMFLMAMDGAGQAVAPVRNRAPLVSLMNEENASTISSYSTLNETVANIGPELPECRAAQQFDGLIFNTDVKSLIGALWPTFNTDLFIDLLLVFILSGLIVLVLLTEKCRVSKINKQIATMSRHAKTSRKSTGQLGCNRSLVSNEANGLKKSQSAPAVTATDVSAMNDEPSSLRKYDTFVNEVYSKHARRVKELHENYVSELLSPEVSPKRLASVEFLRRKFERRLRSSKNTFLESMKNLSDLVKKLNNADVHSSAMLDLIKPVNMVDAHNES